MSSRGNCGGLCTRVEKEFSRSKTRWRQVYWGKRHWTQQADFLTIRASWPWAHVMSVFIAQRQRRERRGLTMPTSACWLVGEGWDLLVHLRWLEKDGVFWYTCWLAGKGWGGGLLIRLLIGWGRMGSSDTLGGKEWSTRRVGQVARVERALGTL